MDALNDRYHAVEGPLAETSSTPKPFLGVFYVTCHVYGRLHKAADGSSYQGRCPRCGKLCKIAIGSGGTRSRQFRAFCR